MIILMKFLTVLFVFASFFVSSVFLLLLPWYFYNKWKKTYLLPLVLSGVFAFFGVVIWLKEYVFASCSDMGCMGVVLVPLIVLGVTAGVFIFFLGVGSVIKRFAVSKNTIYLTSLIIALVLLAGLHVITPPNYSYDSEVVSVTEQYDIRSCHNVEYGLGMFIPKHPFNDLELCNHEVALYAGEDKYCEKLQGKRIQDCKNGLEMIHAISKEKCDSDYDAACTAGECRKHGARNLISIYQCGYQMAKVDPLMCEIFGEQSLGMPHCK
jgi:hypothetical protein